MPDGYRIADEPRPGVLAHLASDPVLPLFGFMFGGAWLAWPWYLLNSVAVGSPTRGREIATVVTGLLGSAAMAAYLVTADRAGRLSEGLTLNFLLLALVTWKLAVTYVLYTLQSRTFEIYRYFGGAVNGSMFILILVGLFLRERIMSALPTFARLVVDR